MAKLRVVAGAQLDAANGDLRSQVHFCAETGQIWLHEHRMLLIHAQAQALLRKELIDTLGMDRAQGLLTRMGYESGVRDAELARVRAESMGDLDAFMTGPQLHTLEGIVKVTQIRLELDRTAGRFYGEFLWENSWEGQWHRHFFGIHTEPVCWTQIGYACGYTSAFMGRPILYKEVECAGMGDDHCRIIGKPLEEWDDASDYAHCVNRESIAEQLIYLQTQVVQLKTSMGENEGLPADMVGNSPAFRAAYELLRQAAGSQITVLLLGETGVGKEVFARTLHERGTRSKASFVAINCAAIQPTMLESELFGYEAGAFTGAERKKNGLMEVADGGVLFLDEISSMPLDIQAKLLRVLQDGTFYRMGDTEPRHADVRLIAASNAPLPALVQAGSFRADLYYRLKIVEIVMPPLRERRTDIPLLASAFLARHAERLRKPVKGFTTAALAALVQHGWPGNARELENAIQSMIVLTETDMLDVDVLPIGLSVSDASAPRRALGRIEPQSLDEIEAYFIAKTLHETQGSRAATAEILGIDKSTLWRKIKRYGLE